MTYLLAEIYYVKKIGMWFWSWFVAKY